MKLYYSDGKLKYDGEGIDGQPHGHGIGYWEDGITIWYDGEFNNGKPEGKENFIIRVAESDTKGTLIPIYNIGEKARNTMKTEILNL